MERRAAVLVRLVRSWSRRSRPRRFFSFDSPPPDSEEATGSAERGGSSPGHQRRRSRRPSRRPPLPSASASTEPGTRKRRVAPEVARGARSGRVRQGTASYVHEHHQPRAPSCYRRGRGRSGARSVGREVGRVGLAGVLCCCCGLVEMDFWYIILFYFIL